MFMVSKILQVFLFPPGFFLLLLAAALVFFFLKKRKIAAGFFSASVFFLYLFSIEPLHNLLLFPLEEAYPPVTPAELPEDGCIVVLGGGTVAASPAEEYGTGLHPDSLKRLVYGYRLHRQTGLDILVSGGSAFLPEWLEPEAEAAGDLLQEFGVPGDAVLEENESRNTYENARRTAELVRGRYDRIVLVTSAYHMKRSVACFEAAGLSCIPAPTDYKIDRAPCTVTSYLPSISSLSGCAAAIREYWGLIYYRIRYGI